MLEDEVVSSLLDRLSSWTSSGAIRSSVAKTTGQSERTVGRRLSELVRLGVIAQRGSGPAIEYRSTGLI